MWRNYGDGVRLFWRLRRIPGARRWHTGEAIKEGDDFFGKHVNLAARVASQAHGGEILVSSLLRGLVESAGDVAWGEPRSVELKGLKGTHEIWPVAWA